MKPAPIAVPQAVLDRIARRVADAELPQAPDDDKDWRYGIDAAWLAELRDYWLGTYDWRKAEARFNELPAFVAEVDGIAVHFFHLRGGSGAYPLILTHGWPGSVTEFLEAAPLLAARGYDVVVPSLPGYGFSGRPPRPIGPARVAELWRKLMSETLGYRRFGAQGGDWGAMVTSALGRNHADAVGAIHLNMLHHRPSRTPAPDVADYLERAGAILQRDGAYAAIQATRPQTIGLALSDTPLGFAGWVSEKCRSWSDCGGDIEAVFSKDALLTNIMTYLVSGNVASAIWMYHGMALEPLPQGRIEVPTGFAEFPGEFIPPPPRHAAEEDYNLVHWSKMDAGGHFAAWEQPVAYAAEVAGFFDRWR
jgi:pimeloyl-ACP methyl ester carboxylesterase